MVIEIVFVKKNKILFEFYFKDNYFQPLLNFHLVTTFKKKLNYIVSRMIQNVWIYTAEISKLFYKPHKGNKRVYWF